MSPPNIARLPELAGNLIYSWDRDLRQLFRYLDNDLYDTCGRNLTLFLRRVAQSRLDAAADDSGFLEAYSRVVSVVRRVPRETNAGGASPASRRRARSDCVLLPRVRVSRKRAARTRAASAFSPVIIARLHRTSRCRSSRSGCCTGRATSSSVWRENGEQVAHYTSTRFEDLPLVLSVDADGRELRVAAPIGDEEIQLRIWRGRVGHSRLVLLDADLRGQLGGAAVVTYRLYGGDVTTRIRQEIVLGIGGVRALRARAHTDRVAPERRPRRVSADRALSRIDRDRNRVSGCARGSRRRERVHDAHARTSRARCVRRRARRAAILAAYCARSGFALGRHRAPRQRSAGSPPEHDVRLRFGPRDTTTASAAIHGSVAAAMERYVWPEVPPEENPIEYVTNGVHLQTFLALEWVNLFDIRFRDWRGNLSNEAYWSCIDDVPDHRF